MDLDLLACGRICRLRQADLQHAVFELGVDVCVVDAVDVERAADFARVALAADVVAVVVLLVLALVMHGGDGEIAILVAEVDILFVTPGRSAESS